MFKNMRLNIIQNIRLSLILTIWIGGVIGWGILSHQVIHNDHQTKSDIYTVGVVMGVSSALTPIMLWYAYKNWKRSPRIIITRASPLFSNNEIHD